VTAGGEFLRASEKQNPDLFWGLRGGGGNFGVVTGFEFALHQVGPEVLSGLVVYPLEQGKNVLERYRRFVKDLPEELSLWSILRLAPPLPFLPQEVHGKGVVVLALCHAGDPEEGKKMIEPLRGFGDVLGELVGVQPYTTWQQAFDPLLTPGARNYWKSHNLTEIEDGLIDRLIEYAGKFPSPQCEMFIGHIGGGPGRVDAGATAYASRDAEFVMNVHSRWDDAKDDGSCISWAREFFEATEPYASRGAYINFMTADEEDRVRSAFGSSYERLVDVKNKYDPKNLFHLNQNVRPTV
jgi:FAD/FMN-containing dehydrogenase